MDDIKNNNWVIVLIVLTLGLALLGLILKKVRS